MGVFLEANCGLFFVFITLSLNTFVNSADISPTQDLERDKRDSVEEFETALNNIGSLVRRFDEYIRKAVQRKIDAKSKSYFVAEQYKSQQHHKYGDMLFSMKEPYESLVTFFHQQQDVTDWLYQPIENVYGIHLTPVNNTNCELRDLGASFFECIPMFEEDRHSLTPRLFFRYRKRFGEVIQDVLNMKQKKLSPLVSLRLSDGQDREWEKEKSKQGKLLKLTDQLLNSAYVTKQSLETRQSMPVGAEEISEIEQSPEIEVEKPTRKRFSFKLKPKKKIQRESHEDMLHRVHELESQIDEMTTILRFLRHWLNAMGEKLDIFFQMEKQDAILQPLDKLILNEIIIVNYFVRYKHLPGNLMATRMEIFGTGNVPLIMKFFNELGWGHDSKSDIRDQVDDRVFERRHQQIEAIAYNVDTIKPLFAVPYCDIDLYHTQLLREVAPHHSTNPYKLVGFEHRCGKNCAYMATSSFLPRILYKKPPDSRVAVGAHVIVSKLRDQFETVDLMYMWQRELVNRTYVISPMKFDFWDSEHSNCDIELVEEPFVESCQSSMDNAMKTLSAARNHQHKRIQKKMADVHKYMDYVRMVSEFAAVLSLIPNHFWYYRWNSSDIWQLYSTIFHHLDRGKKKRQGVKHSKEFGATMYALNITESKPYNIHTRSAMFMSHIDLYVMIEIERSDAMDINKVGRMLSPLIPFDLRKFDKADAHLKKKMQTLFLHFDIDDIRYPNAITENIRIYLLGWFLAALHESPKTRHRMRDITSDDEIEILASDIPEVGRSPTLISPSVKAKRWFLATVFLKKSPIDVVLEMLDNFFKDREIFLPKKWKSGYFIKSTNDNVSVPYLKNKKEIHKAVKRAFASHEDFDDLIVEVIHATQDMDIGRKLQSSYIENQKSASHEGARHQILRQLESPEYFDMSKFFVYSNLGKHFDCGLVLAFFHKKMNHIFQENGTKELNIDEDINDLREFLRQWWKELQSNKAAAETCTEPFSCGDLCFKRWLENKKPRSEYTRSIFDTCPMLDPENEDKLKMLILNAAKKTGGKVLHRLYRALKKPIKKIPSRDIFKRGSKLKKSSKKPKEPAEPRLSIIYDSDDETAFNN